MVAWVTGGGTGIGRALAEALYARGEKVAISGRRADVLRQTADEISRLPGGGSIQAFVADASNPEQVRSTVAEITRLFGPLTLLINNAGSNPNHAFPETSLDEFQSSFQANCLSAVACTQTVLPGMLAGGRGTIVNISSVLGQWASEGSAAYSVAKYAVTGFTDLLRQELIHSPVHVLGVYPGYIDTDMTRPFVEAGTLKSKIARSPAAIAAKILSAVDRKRPELFYPWYVPWVIRMHRWAPLWADRLARRVKR